MPNRIIRDGILDSKAVNSLSEPAEIFYRRLMSVVDDYGRFEADPDLLRVKCFPRQLDRWPVSRVSEMLSEVSRIPTDDGQMLVSIYLHGRKQFLEITNFNQRCRAKSSKCPPREISTDNLPFDAPELGDPYSLAGEDDSLTPKQSEWFTEWWAAYWLKKSKKDAMAAFGKHVCTEVRFREVMAATRAQSPEMLSREPQHRPHGATWLNGERWVDEVGNGTESAGQKKTVYFDLKKITEVRD